MRGKCKKCRSFSRLYYCSECDRYYCYRCIYKHRDYGWF